MTIFHCFPLTLTLLDTLQILVFEDSVLLFRSNIYHEEISVWLIPPLKPAQAVSKVLRTKEPILLVNSPNDDCTICPQRAWFRSNPHHPHYIDLLGTVNDGNLAIARFVLKPIIRNEDPDLPPFIPCLSLKVLPHGDYTYSIQSENFNSTRLWDDSALLLWVAGQNLVANWSEVSPKDKSGSLNPQPTEDDDSSQNSLDSEEEWSWASGKSSSAILYDTIDQPRKSAIAHCPISGRLCIISSNEIRVMDYLVPPAL
jgi:hypothetical protein